MDTWRFDPSLPGPMSEEDRPKFQSHGEKWRTFASIAQLTIALVTLIILIVVHFL